VRRPLGVSRPLVTPADYRELRIAVVRSRVTDAMMRALGATPVDVPPGGAIGGLDAVESAITSIAGNHYDARGGYLTSNVELSARPVVVFAARRRFAALTPEQRRILLHAATASLPAELRRTGDDESANAAVICRRARLRLVTGDVAAMRRAFVPVYRQLERDPATRAAIGAITALKRRLALPADTVVPCVALVPLPATAPTALDGVYRMVTSMRRDGKNDPEPVPENYGVWIYVFTLGRFAFTQEDGPACTWAYGTYSVAADRVEWRFTDAGGVAPNGALNKPGEDFVFHWNRFRDTLTLGSVRGASSPENFFLQPWRRIASAPTRRYFAKRCPPPATALP
jgi:hypothetical protein